MDDISIIDERSTVHDEQWDRAEQAFRMSDQTLGQLRDRTAYALSLIGAMYRSHTLDWIDFLAQHGVVNASYGPQPQSQFHSVCRHFVSLSGGTYTGYATKLASVLDQWAETDIEPEDLPAWIKANGGIGPIHDRSAIHRASGLRPSMGSQVAGMPFASDDAIRAAKLDDRNDPEFSLGSASGLPDDDADMPPDPREKDGEYETPAKLYDPINAEFGFTLDAAATALNTKCQKFFTKDQNGLLQDWGKETVWCQPPFESIRPWLEKANDASLRGATVVMLCPLTVHLVRQSSLKLISRAEFRLIWDDPKFIHHGKTITLPFPLCLLIFRPPAQNNTLEASDPRRVSPLRGDLRSSIGDRASAQCEESRPIFDQDGEYETDDEIWIPRTKFEQTDGSGGFWLIPPAMYAKLNDEFHFDFDPCPYPRPDGFDSLTMEWRKSNYVNPLFVRDKNTGIGPTAFVRKAIEEHQKGKGIVLMLPTPSYVNMLLEAGAELRSAGRVKWLHTDGSGKSKATSSITCFILRGRR